MKLSVIIPIYNVAPMLDRCMESVLNQTFTDCEFILIDDGSTDGSAAMCDDYMSKDSRVRVIHKENGGLSEARNDGLSLAKGDYVTFVDSDDFLDKDTYRLLMQHIEAHPEYDILEYPVIVHYGSSGAHALRFTDKAYTDTKKYWFEEEAYTHGYMCNKIFKRSLFNDVLFPKGRKFEDIYVYPQLLDNAGCVAVVSCGQYYYCWNESGITVTATNTDYDDLLYAHLRSLHRFDKNDYRKYDFLRYYLHILNIQCDACRNKNTAVTLPGIRLPFFKNIFSLMRNDRLITVLKFFALKLFGVSRTCRLVNAVSHR